MRTVVTWTFKMFVKFHFGLCTGHCQGELSIKVDCPFDVQHIESMEFRLKVEIRSTYLGGHCYYTISDQPQRQSVSIDMR